MIYGQNALMLRRLPLRHGLLAKERRWNGRIDEKMDYGENSLGREVGELHDAGQQRRVRKATRHRGIAINKQDKQGA